MGWLLDLRSQVRRILPARYGGTGNDQSAAQLTAVTCRVRQTGAAITRGMVVRMNGPYLVDPIASSTADGFAASTKTKSLRVFPSSGVMMRSASSNVWAVAGGLDIGQEVPWRKMANNPMRPRLRHDRFFSPALAF